MYEEMSTKEKLNKIRVVEFKIFDEKRLVAKTWSCTDSGCPMYLTNASNSGHSKGVI